MAWNTNIDFTDATLVSTNLVLKDIVNAVNERCEVAGKTKLQDLYLGEVGTPTFLDADNLHLYTPLRLVAIIGMKINELCGISPYGINNAKFVDTSQAPFDGESSIPLWTEDALLEDIYTTPADRVRLLDPWKRVGLSTGQLHDASIGVIDAAWVEQVYQILNRLVWTIEPVYSSDSYRRDAGESTLWEDSNWDSSSGKYPAGIADYASYYSPYSYRYRYACKFSLTKSTTYESIADFYMYTSNPYSWTDGTSGYVENAYNLVDTSVQSAASPVLSTEIGRIETEPPVPTIGTRYYGWNANNNTNFAVIKWNVTNGFEYQ